MVWDPPEKGLSKPFWIADQGPLIKKPGVEIRENGTPGGGQRPGKDDLRRVLALASELAELTSGKAARLPEDAKEGRLSFVQIRQVCFHLLPLSRGSASPQIATQGI